MTQTIGYDTDYLRWLEDQARHLRAGDLERLDREHLSEELDGMSRSERRQLRNRLIILVSHLLKMQCQPERRSRSWGVTVITQRIGQSLDLQQAVPKHLAGKGASSSAKRRLDTLQAASASEISAMALTIVNEEVERLARALAIQTGEPIPQLILFAMQERAGRLQHQRSEVSAIALIRQSRARCAQLPDLDPRSAEDVPGYTADGAFDPW